MCSSSFIGAKITIPNSFLQVDVAIMEVGLGGRYDATNVVSELFGNPFLMLVNVFCLLNN